jgi:hypothetical protein
VTVVQTQLFDFSSGTPAVADIARSRLYPPGDAAPSAATAPKLALSATGVIELARPFCPQCGRKLAKWGVNPRSLILDKGHLPAVKGLQRYRCPKHGEVPVDLSAWVRRGARYAENFRRRACRLVFHGHVPAGACRAFEDCFDVSPSEKSVRNWTREAAEAAGAVVHHTKVPTSGFMGYDEIHVRVNGKKEYIITGADLHTNFVPPAEHAPKLGKVPARQYLRQAKKVSSEKLAGLVADGTNEFGTLFQEPEFDRVAVQRCQTHYKKKLNEKIYEAAGLGKKLKDPLPEPYDWVKRELFAPFKRSTGLRAELQVVYADTRLRGNVSPAVDALLDDLIAHAPALFLYHEITRLNRTNNKDERWNNELQKYPSLKTRMKTGAGVQRVCDGMTFLRNWEAFETYIAEMEAKIEKLKTLVGADLGNADLKPELRGAIAHLRWVRKWQATYAEVYDRYFKVLPEPQ